MRLWIHPVSRAGGSSVMDWAVTSWSLQGPLVKLSSILTGTAYTVLVTDHLHLFIVCISPSGDVLIQPDKGNTSIMYG